MYVYLLPSLTDGHILENANGKTKSRSDIMTFMHALWWRISARLERSAYCIYIAFALTRGNFCTI